MRGKCPIERQSNKLPDHQKSVVNTVKLKTPHKKRDKNKTIIHSRKADQMPIEKSRRKIRQRFYLHLKERTNYQRLTMPHDQFLTKKEICEFVSIVEQEMYNIFGFNSKYLLKYRQLVANVTDINNDVLFLNISRKIVEPHGLVRMTINELASAERIEERQTIQKNILKRIAHAETDKLAQPLALIKKTHKGEEIVVNRNVKTVQLNPNVDPRYLVTEFNAVTGANIGDMICRPACATPRRFSLISA